MTASYAVETARELAKTAGLTELSDTPTLMLNKPGEVSYLHNLFGDGSERAEDNAGRFVKVQRVGKALEPNWSFHSGDKVGVLREVADGQLRWNDPPEDKYAPCPLIELTGLTNLMSNPWAEGADPYTDNAMPTWWQSWNPAGTTLRIAQETLDNWPGAKLTFSGAASGGTLVRTVELGSNLATNPSSVYSMTVNLARLSATLTNIASIKLGITYYTSGDVYAGGAESPALTVDSEHRRFHWAVSSPANAAKATFYVLFTFSSAAAVAGEVGMYGACNYEGAEPVSPAFPAPGEIANATRGAETRNGGLQCERDGRAIGDDWDGTNGGIVSSVREYLKHAPVSEGCFAKRMPATVNKVRNSRDMVGAAVGTPGTAPTHFSLGDNGTTREIVAINDYGPGKSLHLKYSGTMASGEFLVTLEPSAGAWAQNTDYTGSAYMRLISGDLGQFDSVTLHLFFWSDSGLQHTATQDITALLNPRWRRLFVQGKPTAAPGSNPWIEYRLDFNKSGGGAITPIEIEFALPQMEALPYPTPPALPDPGTTGEASRAETVTYIPTGAHTENNRAGTLYARFRINYLPDAANYPRILSFGADGSNEIGFILNGDLNTLEGAIRDGGVVQAGASKAVAVGDVVDVAVAFATNDVAISFNGKAQSLDSSADISLGGSQLQFGASVGGTAASGPVEILAARYFSSRLPNAETEALVGNS